MGRVGRERDEYGRIISPQNPPEEVPLVERLGGFFLYELKYLANNWEGICKWFEIYFLQIFKSCCKYILAL